MALGSTDGRRLPTRARQYRVLCELRGKKRKEGKHRRIHHLDSNLGSGVANDGEAAGGASGGGVSSRTKSSSDE